MLVFASAAAADARIEQAPDAEALRKPFSERYPFINLNVLRATGQNNFPVTDNYARNSVRSITGKLF